jgi:transposase
MRYGIYSLAGLVRNELGFDPASGDVFVFLGKRLNQIRLLQWDRSRGRPGRVCDVCQKA